MLLHFETVNICVSILLRQKSDTHYLTLFEVLEAAEDGLDLGVSGVLVPAFGDPRAGDLILTRPVADSIDNLEDVDRAVDGLLSGFTTADLGRPVDVVDTDCFLGVLEHECVHFNARAKLFQVL